MTAYMKKRHTGFTLVELLMTLIIVSIVVSLGAPALTDMIRSNRLTTQANELVTALNLARSEAIKRNATITMCASSNQNSCTNDGWKNGWIILSNNEVLRAFGPMKGLASITSSADSLQYLPTGFINGGTTFTFDLCAKTGQAGRKINITPTGRPNNVTPYPTC